MAKDYTICIGTVGQGLWHSPDGGETWQRMRQPFPLESRVRALALHPTEAHTLFAGADSGLYRSRDNGASWERVSAPEDSLNVWSLALSPADPGDHLRRHEPFGRVPVPGWGPPLGAAAPGFGERVCYRHTRVTATVVDPNDARIVWAGVEIDGVHRSLDGGDTWARVAGGSPIPTSTAWSSRGATHPRAHEHAARDLCQHRCGESWQRLHIAQHFPAPYCRWIAVKPDDPQVIFAACGDSAIGSSGNLQRSTDGGQSWRTLPLPVEPNSPLYGFAVNAATPDRLLAYSLFGEIYASEDAGDSWQKVKREFSEIRAIAWQPN